MKTVLIICLGLFLNGLYALPVGNPSEASLFRSDECESCRWVGFGIGFYGDYVFNRHLKTKPGKDVDTVKLFTNAAYLLLTVKERAELFATLGTSRLSLNTSLTAFNKLDPFPLFEIESGTRFSYSIGARATLYEFKCFSLGIEGQYFSTKPDIKRVYIASGAVAYLDDKVTTHYKEWQIGSGISYRYNPYFTPYVAAKYSRAHWKLANGRNILIESNTGTFFYNLHSKKQWGYAVGLTLNPYACHQLAVTVEGRFGDERAIYVNGQLRF